MRKVVLSILMIFCAIGIKAQKSPMIDRSHPAIPDSGRCVIKGDVANVPDGTIVNFWFEKNGDYLGEIADTITGGKFRFEWNVDKWARYFITLGDWRFYINIFLLKILMNILAEIVIKK